MILTPHMLAGAAVGAFFNKKRLFLLLFIASLLSHYLLDAIPHSEYEIAALKNGLNAEFIADSLKVFLDLSSGIILLIALSRKMPNFYFMLSGALIALIPDLFIFLSWQTDIEVFHLLTNFGIWVHAQENGTTSLTAGILTQFAAVMISVLIILIKNRAKKPDWFPILSRKESL